MRILHVISSLDPSAGGPPVVASRLAAGQASLGHDVAVLSASEPQSRSRVELALEAVPYWRQVRLHEIPASLSPWRCWLGNTERQWLDPLIASADVVHLHGVWEPLLVAAGRAAKRQDTPYVIVPHGMLDPWSLRQRYLKKRVALALIYRRHFNSAALLHVLNQEEQALIEPLGFKAPTAIIPNGVFLEEIEPLPEQGIFRKACPALADRPFVLFLSRLHYKKGLDVLADAFAMVAQAVEPLDLVVAGPDGGAQADFERAVASAGLRQRVHVIGPIYGSMKYAAMVDAACFCLPSRQEGFSVAITEALACGAPTVITEGCHFPEVAEVGAGEVVALDAQAVASALQRVVADSSLRRSMSQAARELVKSRYTWPRIAEMTVACYHSMSVTTDQATSDTRACG